MREKVAEIAEKFIHLEIIGLAFLLPLFFLPITVEFYEFNKLVLLSILVILGTLAWSLKAVLTGNFGVRRSPFDLPVVIFFFVALISAIFSDSRLVSLIGQYARWHPSLFSVSIFTLLFFLVTWNSNERTLQNSVRALLASAGVAAGLFWPQYFGANLFGQDWSNRITFTPLGSPTVLALFLGAVAGLALQEMVAAEKRWQKILFLITFLLFALTLTLLNSPIGWVALGTSAILALLTSSVPALTKNKIYLLTALVIPAVFAAAVLIPTLFNKKTFLNRDFPKEVTLDLRTSWSVAATSFRQKPLWGSGLATFSEDFTRYKPLRFNQTELWTIRFDKPLNEYLLAFAEAGLLGIISWIILITIVVRSALRGGDWKLLPAGAAVLAGWLLTNATIATTFILVLALASVSATSSGAVPQPSRRKRAWETTVLVIALVLGGLVFNLVYRSYTAEVLQRKARRAEDILQAYDYQRQSVIKFPWQATNRLALAQTSFLLASELASKENPSQSEQDSIKTLVAQAISEAREATNLHPLNAGNWEGLAQIYRSLSGLTKDAETWAADSYQKAVALDLFNPLTRIGFGGFYYQMGDFAKAAEQFRAAVNLKPDYANAHYNLGRAYKELGEKDLAIQELETALRLSNPEVSGYEEAKQVLDELKSQ